LKTILALGIFFFITSEIFSQEQDSNGFKGFGGGKSAKTEQQDTTGFKGFKVNKIPFQMNVIKASPVSWLVGPAIFNGELRILYERMVAYNQSLLVGISYNYPSPLLLAMASAANSSGGGSTSNLKEFSVNGARFQLAYRYYLFKKLKAPMGFYVGPHLSYNYIDIRQKNLSSNQYTYNNFFACAAFGFQVRIKKHVYIDITNGIGYKKNWGTYFNQVSTTSSSNSVLDLNKLPIKLMVQLAIGYGF